MSDDWRSFLQMSIILCGSRSSNCTMKIFLIYSFNRKIWKHARIFVWCKMRNRRWSRISFKFLFSISKRRRISSSLVSPIEQHRKPISTKHHHDHMQFSASLWSPSTSSTKNPWWVTCVGFTNRSATIEFLLSSRYLRSGGKRTVDGYWKAIGWNVQHQYLVDDVQRLYSNVEWKSNVEVRHRDTIMPRTTTTDLNLSRKQMLVPYRNSVLTSIFRPFFVGRGRTIICCNVNPCATFVTQTNDLLKFCALAQKVRSPLSRLLFWTSIVFLDHRRAQWTESGRWWINSTGKKIETERTEALGERRTFEGQE